MFTVPEHLIGSPLSVSVEIHADISAVWPLFFSYFEFELQFSSHFGIFILFLSSWIIFVTFLLLVHHSTKDLLKTQNGTYVRFWTNYTYTVLHVFIDKQVHWLRNNISRRGVFSKYSIRSSYIPWLLYIYRMLGGRLEFRMSSPNMI